MSTDKDTASWHTINSSSKNPFDYFRRISRFRRIVMLAILAAFLMQLAGVNITAGSLTGSSVFSIIRMLDPFAYLETIAASRDINYHAFVSLIPVLLLYVLIGRAFCGWVCPMDFLYELVGLLRDKGIKPQSFSADVKTSHKRRSFAATKLTYIIMALLLILSGLLGLTLFSNYLSHLTNLFRAITSGYFVLTGLPVEMTVLIYSAGVIISLLILELLFPRLWCKTLCPVGKTYGIFNKISLLRLSVRKGTCIQCEVCNRVCYMGVPVSAYTEKSAVRDTNCILCGRCAESCSEKGRTLNLTFRRRR